MDRAFALLMALATTAMTAGAADKVLVLKVRSFEQGSDSAVIAVLDSGEKIVVSGGNVDLALTKMVQTVLDSQEAEEKIVTTSAPPSAQEAASLINSRCREKWNDDFKMQKYCRDKQNEALEKLHRRSMTSATGQKIRSQCASKWPEDFTMRVYCENQQIEALQSLR